MSDFPDPSVDYQSQQGDSQFQNMYVTGKLNYAFDNDDITMHSLKTIAGITGNVVGNVTGDLTGNADTATTAEGLTSLASIDTFGDLEATDIVSKNNGDKQGFFRGDGSKLIGISTVLTGQIIMWGGNIAGIPTTYLLCNGQAVSRTDFAPLFTVLNVYHGNGNGTTTFNVPDLRNNFIIGASLDHSSDGQPRTGIEDAGDGDQTGGSKDAVVVQHDHDFSGDTDNDTHAHSVKESGTDDDGGSRAAAGNSNQGNMNATNNDTHDHSFSGDTDNEGVSGTNRNLPPYYALVYIIKT